MKFDIELHRQLSDSIIIDYGIIKGNNNILLIKAGQDGSMYGYNNKYLEIAKAINKEYGSTVICSSNPFDGNNPLDDAMQVIELYCQENNIKDYEIYYMGHSKGGLIGVWFGINYTKIKRMLLVNAPLMYNYSKTKDGIKSMDQVDYVLYLLNNAESLIASLMYSIVIHIIESASFSPITTLLYNGEALSSPNF